MAEKKTKLTVRMSPEECWEMLETSVNGVFTTLRANGQPIALPVWYVVLDQKISRRAPSPS